MNELSQHAVTKVSRKIRNLPKPKPFHITEPHQEGNLWCFWLTAENEVLRFVHNLHCILLPTQEMGLNRAVADRVRFGINPRYDHEETWLWLHEMLESEATQVELNEEWEDAIFETLDDAD